VPLDPSPFDPSIWHPIHLVALVAVGAAGWGVGFVGSRGSARAARLRELEQELEEARRELASYRERVAGHFTETSKHLRDLALQYRTVYEHLADGARTLCPEAAVPIEAGLPGSLLAEPSASEDESRLTPPETADGSPESAAASEDDRREPLASPADADPSGAAAADSADLVGAQPEPEPDGSLQEIPNRKP